MGIFHSWGLICVQETSPKSLFISLFHTFSFSQTYKLGKQDEWWKLPQALWDRLGLEKEGPPRKRKEKGEGDAHERRNPPTDTHRMTAIPACLSAQLTVPFRQTHWQLLISSDTHLYTHTHIHREEVLILTVLSLRDVYYGILLSQEHNKRFYSSHLFSPRKLFTGLTNILTHPLEQ